MKICRFIDGKEFHPRDLYDKEGTSGVKYLKQKYGERLKTKSKLPKEIYLYDLVGKRKWQKKITT